jgi:ABC-2 type transport system permease protein
MFFVQPLGAVYYPVSTLPNWLQPVSWTLPPTYVFEGLRALLIDHVIRWDLLAQGLAIDALLFSLACFAFGKLLNSARRAGTLLQAGE